MTKTVHDSINSIPRDNFDWEIVELIDGRKVHVSAVIGECKSSLHPGYLDMQLIKKKKCLIRDASGTRCNSLVQINSKQNKNAWNKFDKYFDMVKKDTNGTFALAAETHAKFKQKAEAFQKKSGQPISNFNQRLEDYEKRSEISTNEEPENEEPMTTMVLGGKTLTIEPKQEHEPEQTPAQTEDIAREDTQKPNDDEAIAVPKASKKRTTNRKFTNPNQLKFLDVLAKHLGGNHDGTTPPSEQLQVDENQNNVTQDRITMEPQQVHEMTEEEELFTHLTKLFASSSFKFPGATVEKIEFTSKDTVIVHVDYYEKFTLPDEIVRVIKMRYKKQITALVSERSVLASKNVARTKGEPER